MTVRHAACLFLVFFVPAAAMAAERRPETATERWSPFTLFRKPPRPAAMVVDGFLWIEAEDFADYGDWRLDTQFVQQMGAAYLIAAGVGRPGRSHSGATRRRTRSNRCSRSGAGSAACRGNQRRRARAM